MYENILGMSSGNILSNNIKCINIHLVAVSRCNELFNHANEGYTCVSCLSLSTTINIITSTQRGDLGYGADM